MYWSPSWARILNVQDINTKIRIQVKIYFQRVFLPPPSPVLPNIHSIIAACLYDVARTDDVGLPTKFRLNVVPASQPIAGSMPVNCLQCPTLIQHWVSCILCASTSANMCHSPNAVLMLTHSHRRRPDIETTLGDYTVFPDCGIVMRVTLSIPAPETPDNTIHWPSAAVMLGHRLRRWANIIQTQTL